MYIVIPIIYLVIGLLVTLIIPTIRNGVFHLIGDIFQGKMRWWEVVLAVIFLILVYSIILPVVSFFWPLWVIQYIKDLFQERYHRKCIKAMSFRSIATKKPIDDWFKASMIVYVESEYHPHINPFILNNYTEIHKRFKSAGYDFIYLPVISNGLLSKFNNSDFLSYHYPYLNDEERNQIKSSLGDLDSGNFVRRLFKDSDNKAAVKPGFVRKKTKTEFEYLQIDTDIPEGFKACLLIFFSDLNLEIPKFRVAPNQYNDLSLKADNSFSTEANKLAKEIQEKIELLKAHGYEQLVSNIILGNKHAAESHNPPISRILISSDYKIYLTDYSNVEIELTPLPKTVFLFFLNHPEGVMFKFLSDYKEELLTIYRQLSQREDNDEMDKSINDLINPLSNSINEKCSRIKEAFVKHFSDDLARNYYIRGERREPKKIDIDRQLVTCEISGLIDPAELKEPTRTLESEQDDWHNALSFIKKKDYFEGIKHFSAFISKNPLHSGAFFNRAFAYAEVGEYEKGEADNTRSIQLDHPGGLAYHNRAEDRYFLEKYPEALEDINHYIENFSDYKAESYFLKGLIFEKIDDMAAACKYWEIAKEQGDTRADQYLIKYPEIRSTK